MKARHDIASPKQRTTPPNFRIPTQYPPPPPPGFPFSERKNRLKFEPAGPKPRILLELPTFPEQKGVTKGEGMENSTSETVFLSPLPFFPFSLLITPSPCIIHFDPDPSILFPRPGEPCPPQRGGLLKTLEVVRLRQKDQLQLLNPT